MHADPHPLARKTVRLKAPARHPEYEGGIGGTLFRVEDWYDRISGQSWMEGHGDPACLLYAIHAGDSKLPTDDEVVCGRIGAFGLLLHVSELETSPA